MKVDKRQMFEKVGRSGGYFKDQHIAQDLVEGGKCGSYDEAYELLRGMGSGDVVQTYRGHFKKDGSK